ncbi:MAG TPA: sulfite exporter TauE/SafE family protein [Dongiaceae bacterium]|nr:sulfite exporter TauE/SafE family protein [Dongiaceae bacterium]
MPDVLHLALFLALGGVLGVLGGLFGLGGGIIAIPVLGLAFGLDEQHAQGTALVMVAPNVLIGLWGYARRGSVDRRVAILLGACAVPFTYLGALYATRIAGPGLRYGFGAYAAVLAVWFTYRTLSARSDEPAAAPRLAWGWTGVVGALGGILSGVFSVGGAIFAVPFLSLVFAFSQTEAQGLSLALVAPGTIVGIAAYALAGDVDWGIGIPLAAGGALCVRYGVAIAHRLPERRLRLLFCAFLAAAAIGLLSRGS